MASSPIVFGVYQPQALASGFERFSAQFLAQLRTWSPVLVCAMVFAVESTPYFGSDHTSTPLQRVAEAVLGYDACAHWGVIHYFIRKTGHFMGYGIFSLVCFRGFWISLERLACRLPRQLRAHGLAILATFLVASADEIHQSFLPNRDGRFSDVLLDTLGGVVLGLVVFLIMQAAESRRRQARKQASFRREPACAEATA